MAKAVKKAARLLANSCTAALLRAWLPHRTRSLLNRLRFPLITAEKYSLVKELGLVVMGVVRSWRNPAKRGRIRCTPALMVSKQLMREGGPSAGE